jgi:hypothetical protein
MGDGNAPFPAFFYPSVDSFCIDFRIIHVSISLAQSNPMIRKEKASYERDYTEERTGCQQNASVPVKVECA